MTRSWFVEGSKGRSAMFNKRLLLTSTNLSTKTTELLSATTTGRLRTFRTADLLVFLYAAVAGWT